MATAAISPIPANSRLAPLSPDLEPDVRAFVEHLRTLFGLTELSVRRLATLHCLDAGAISRYLSGTRLPPARFLDDLLRQVACRRGAPVTPEVQEQTHDLYLAALQVRSPDTYKYQLAVDEARAYEIALRESELTVAALQEAVAARESRLYDAEMARRALATAAATERLENAEEHARRDTERQRLIDEIAQLKKRLELALRSRDRALEKVHRLEEELTALEDKSSSVVDSADLRDARELASRIVEDALRKAEVIKAKPIRVAHETASPQMASEIRAAARLRALAGFAKSMAAAHSVDDVIRIAVREARHDLRAAIASIAMWEHDDSRLRVLANHGRLAAGQPAVPGNESWPVSAFPEIMLSEEDIGPWIQLADEEHGDPLRVSMLRRRRQNCALIAPIVYNGRAWGELYATRTVDQPVYDREDMDFAAALTAQIAAGLAKADHVRRMERLAYTDQLTGLRNRRSFDARLDAAIERHAKSGIVVSLIICQAIGVKEMTDRQGRDQGEALLVQLAGVVSNSAKLLPGSLAAQYSGDEFCILAEDCAADHVVFVAEELCDLATNVLGGHGVTCGVASTGDRIGDVTTRERLFRLADTARYRAERSGSRHPVVAGRDGTPVTERQLT